MKWWISAAVLTALLNFLSAEIPVFIVNRDSGSLECRDRSVCADVYNFTRTLRSGSRQEVRIVKNCRCPNTNDGECPVVDNHMLHASTMHKQYLCQPVDTLPMCTEASQSAEDMVEGDEEFDFYNYWRINCRCPRHSEPVEPIPGQLERATQWRHMRPDWGRHMFIHEYICDNEYGRREDN